MVEKINEIAGELEKLSFHQAALFCAKDLDFLWALDQKQSKNNIFKMERFLLERSVNQLFESGIKEESGNDALDSAALKAMIVPGPDLSPSRDIFIHHLLHGDFSISLKGFPFSILYADKDQAALQSKLDFPLVQVKASINKRVLLKNIRKALIDQIDCYLLVPKLGLFISAESHQQLIDMFKKLLKHLPEAKDSGEIENRDRSWLANVLPALRMFLTDQSFVPVLSVRSNIPKSWFEKLNQAPRFLTQPLDEEGFSIIGNGILLVKDTNKAESSVNQLKKAVLRWNEKYQSPPRVIFLKSGVLIASGIDYEQAEKRLFKAQENLHLANHLDNVHFLSAKDCQQLAAAGNPEIQQAKSVLSGKIALVTGGAQGFGRGIAENLVRQGAHVLIVDLNSGAGEKTAEELNLLLGKKAACFFKGNVSQLSSMQEAVHYCVSCFGGLDLLISNAGILRAGGLTDIDEQTFELMTNVNYKGYYICAKSAAPVMKLQHQSKADYYMDIIQINSKSGLRGSKNNFTYAGGKFGGVGLTESFALELVDYNIKVNSICPGNFFEGPLWSDSKKGLFVQYLKAGKVPGAKTIEDVRRHYESQVPMKRGCLSEDVFKAIVYAVDQKYETGQAIPVSGGQVMLK